MNPAINVKINIRLCVLDCSSVNSNGFFVICFINPLSADSEIENPKPPINCPKHSIVMLTSPGYDPKK